MTTATTNGQTKKKVAKKKVAKKDAPEFASQQVVVQPLNIGKLRFRLVGKTPLVTHNFDAKSRQEMLEKQMSKTQKTSKSPRCPEEEFLQSLYWVKGKPPSPKLNKEGLPYYEPKTIFSALKKGRFGIPLTGIKGAMISACRNTDLTMAGMNQTIFVSSPVDPDFAILEGELPYMDNRIVRISKNTPMERFRARFDKWSTVVDVEWDKNTGLNRDQIANLLSIAGYYVGLCEGRPEKCTLGWGRFEIEM